MAKRPIKPLCADAPKRGLSLVPCGLFLNKNMEKAKAGDVLVLGEARRKVKRVLVRKCKVRLDTSIGCFIVRHIYGDKAQVGDIMERWKAECVVEGYGNNAIGDVWLLETQPFDAEVEAAEDELAEIEVKKAELSEQLEARRAELEVMLANARKGIFNHKDIL